MNRYQMYGLIHKGMTAKLAIELGEFTDCAYRACLKKLTGKESCKEMTFQQLQLVLDSLRDGGYLNTVRTDTANTPLKPTDAQWRKLAALSYSKGWSGLKDAALARFVKRTAHVSKVKSLTRAQISEVITGLEKWNSDYDSR
ncbi:TPA: regulatory protein GemA [Photobacterium damselae]